MYNSNGNRIGNFVARSEHLSDVTELELNVTDERKHCI
jgi:hypothetical protein